MIWLSLNKITLPPYLLCLSRAMERFQVHNIQLLLLVSRLFKLVSHFVLLLYVLTGSLENKRLRTLEK